MKKVIFLALFFYNLSFVAQTKVSGVVYDDTNQTLPYANIYFKDSKIGVTSDENGKFTLQSTSDYKSIIVKYVGFEDLQVDLITATTSNLKITLAATKQLTEVVVVGKPRKHVPKEKNPAYAILQQVWKNKKNNALNFAKNYQYTQYTSVANGLSNLDSIFLKRVLGKQYDSVIKIADYKEKQKTYSIPTYLQESNQKIYKDNLLNKTKLEILAQRTTGIADKGFIMEKITNFIQPFDIYDNDVLVFGKSFVSPISDRGYSQYEYVLQDTITNGEQKIYEIYFFPRNNQDLLFQGSFKVADKSFAITEILLHNNNKINLNFVRNFTIEKTYTIQENNIYLPERETYAADFTFLSKEDQEKGMYLKKNILYSDYILDKTMPSNFYDTKATQPQSSLLEKGENYWQQLTNRQAGINNTRTIIVNLKNNKRIKGVTNALTIISSGYFTVCKGIQYGSIYQTISNNDIEGIRIKAGFRTFKTPNDYFRLNGYLAYGSKDHKVKFGLSGKYLINPANPSITLGVGFVKDNLQLSNIGLEETELLTTGPNTNVIIARGNNYTLTHTQKSVFAIDVLPDKNFKINFSAVHRNMQSANENYFSLAYQLPNQEAQKTVVDFSTSLGLFYTPNRNVYGYGVEPSFSRSNFSTFSLKFTHGFKGILNSNFDYDKIQISYNKPLAISNFGVLKTNIEAAQVFQTVPLSLLTPVVVNQAYSIATNAFSLLDYYDFVTNKYLCLKLEHHFNGYLFNRLPIIKKLKCREIIFYKTVIGQISDNNKAINQSSIVYNAPTQRYSEYGFGIENIGIGNFKPIRIDFIWRSNFTDLNGLLPPKFGIRFGFFPDF